MPPNNIDNFEMQARLQNNEAMQVLDVREAMEFYTYNIGGLNIPLSVLHNRLPELDKASEIIVVCKAGLRSQTAQSILIKLGYTNVRNLKGGLLALQKLNKTIP